MGSTASAEQKTARMHVRFEHETRTSTRAPIRMRRICVRFEMRRRCARCELTKQECKPGPKERIIIETQPSRGNRY
eukprot:3416537-Rhodomonas_salina.1